jgi:hypothetical protein
MTDLNNPTNTSEIPDSSAPNATATGVSISSTVGSGSQTLNPNATAPATTAIPPLTDKQHQTLYAKLEELPADIAAWVKKKLKLAETDIKKI